MARIDQLFDQLLSCKGSDLHLAVGQPPMARVRGDLIALREGAVNDQEMRALLFEITNDQQRHHIETEWDLDFAYAFGTRARFRANYFFKHTGLAAVFRTIPSKVLTLAELKTPEIVKKLAERRSV